TDEFCPPEAGWRIRSRRASFPSPRVDTLDIVGLPWVLEPDKDHLIALLNEAAADTAERRRRGAAGRASAERRSWDIVAARYRERLTKLSSTIPLQASDRRREPFALTEDVTTRVLATPAWRGS